MGALASTVALDQAGAADSASILTRPALSSHPVFYVRVGARVRSSSDPSVLASHLSRGSQLDVAALARHLANRAQSDDTLFDGVSRVPPGSTLAVDRNSTLVDRWRPERIEIIDRPDHVAASLLREALEASVQACLDAVPGDVASHLSGGRDSSAVTVVAARLLAGQGRRLHAFTAAPMPRTPSHPRYIVDESAAAASVAALHPNIDHHVVRSVPFDLIAAMDRIHRHHHEPIPCPVNLPWWEQIERQAVDAGAGLLLTGGCGNFGLSAGGPDALPDLLASAGVGAWFREAVRIAGASPGRWRRVANLSFGGWLAPAWHGRARRVARRFSAPIANEFVAGSLKAASASVTPVDDRPARSYRAELVQRLIETDNSGEPGHNGLTLCDPTADQVLVELVLSFTDRQLASPEWQRKVYDLAFADLPPAILRPTARGLQSADWHCVIDPQSLRAGMTRYAEHGLVRKLFDLQAIDEALADWPGADALEPKTYDRFVNRLLPTIAAASFIALRFADWVAVRI